MSASGWSVRRCSSRPAEARSSARGFTSLNTASARRQYHGVSALKGVFPAAVLDPIRLHVDAKRYLCAVDAAYWAALSDDSKRSLQLQGGTFSPQDAARFIAQPYAQDAVRLRRWDDLAKVAGCETPALEHYLDIAAQTTVR